MHKDSWNIKGVFFSFFFLGGHVKFVVRGRAAVASVTGVRGPEVT